MTTVRWSISGYERYRDYIASAIKEMYRENGGFVLDGNVLVAEHAYHNKAEVRSVLETAKRMYLSDHVSEDFFRELFDQLGEDGKKASGEKSESGSYEINWTGIISTLIVEAGKSCKHFASDVFYDLLRIEEQLKQGEVLEDFHLFGFRESGVDHGAYIVNKLKDSSMYGYNIYDSIWGLELETSGASIKITLRWLM